LGVLAVVGINRMPRPAPMIIAFMKRVVESRKIKLQTFALRVSLFCLFF